MALLRMEEGELDVLFSDVIPAADFPRLIGDTNSGDWMLEEPSMCIWWPGLDNKMASLDNTLLGQALNQAIP
jgi:hypothetical protein